MKKQGFGLIEALIFASVVELLFALIIPRFLYLASEARVVIVKQIEGSIRTATSIVHLTQTVNNLPPNSSVRLSDTEITMINGYPTADSDGILKAIGSDDGKPPLGFTVIPGNPLILQCAQARDPSKCKIFYYEAVANGFPKVRSIIDGC